MGTKRRPKSLRRQLQEAQVWRDEYEKRWLASRKLYTDLLRSLRDLLPGIRDDR